MKTPPTDRELQSMKDLVRYHAVENKLSWAWDDERVQAVARAWADGLRAVYKKARERARDEKAR